jgi:rod shape-determining protein MreC
VFRLKRNNITSIVVSSVILIAIALSVPVLRPPTIKIIKFPLTIAGFIKQEIQGIIFFHRNMHHRESLIKENQTLKRRLNESEEIKIENARLLELISFKKKTPFKVIVARVISRPADNWSSMLIIDKGKTNGIRVGFVVINYLGLLGRVVEANQDTSTVMLINDANSGVSSIIQRNRQEGLVTGTLSSSLIMKYLPLDADVQVGDAVITSGLTENYPKGILVGSVAKVGKEFSGLSRYAVIKPAVDLSNIEEVLIVIK